VLVLLIDSTRVTARIIDEPAVDGHGTPFPHIYGPLNRDANVCTARMLRRADGTFEWRDDAEPD
jgi:uncharacterized protein (DUF952 family)